MSSQTFNIGSLSKRTGCNIETIRYYERIGLIPPPTRSENGYRVYDNQYVKRLTFICRCRELGFSQLDINKLLKLVDQGAYTCSEIEEMVKHQLAIIQNKISQLQLLEQALVDMSNLCQSDKTPGCPTVDLLFNKLIS